MIIGLTKHIRLSTQMCSAKATVLLTLRAAVGFGLSLTYLILLFTGIVPPSEKDVLAEFGVRSLFVDHTQQTLAEWSSHEHTSFICQYNFNEYGYYCGIDIRVGDGKERGEDLSGYSHLRLSVMLQGEGRYLRVNYRNAFEDYRKSPEGKQLEKVYPINSGLNNIVLNLDDFTIPYWWLDDHPELEGSDLAIGRDNVTHIGFYFEEPKSVGRHKFDIVSFSVLNTRLQVINAIMTIIFLVSALALVVAAGILYLRRPVNPKRVDRKPKGDIRALCDQYKTRQSSVLDIYDPITGLLSHATTVDLIDEYERQYSFANMVLILITLERYDAVKAEFGVPVASEYRATTALTIKSNLASLGICCNWDDSKQLIILPQATASSADKLLTKIRNDCADTTYARQELPLVVSATMVPVASREGIYEALGVCEVPFERIAVINS